MAFCIRTPDGDYWSNRDGWTNHKVNATFFDTQDETSNFILADQANVQPYAEEVPNATAGYYALRQITVAHDDSDPYGWAMSWWFAICDRLHFATDTTVPDEWQFSPSPLGPTSSDDEYKSEILQDFSDRQLCYVGEVLHRYVALLKLNGKDY